MNEQSTKAYQAAIDTANKASNVKKRLALIEKARQELFSAQTTAGAAPVVDDFAHAPSIGNPFFERISCLGFYPQERRLEAVVHLNQNWGYGGNLGTIGSYEYVGLWVNWNGDGDFNDTGENVGLTYVHVFDPGVLHSSVGLPICYSVYRDIIPLPTLKPGTIVRARAILSWQVPPIGPNFVPVWGSRLDCFIRIDPVE